MATHRYRMRFRANFTITIDAADDAEARVIAAEMEQLPWGSWAAAADAHKVRCKWRFSERLDPGQEPTRIEMEEDD